MAINDNWIPNWLPWNAKVFGAKEDGVTDDTAAIQAAKNHNEAMGFPTLPICAICPSEVKPGEDLCWGCLGEDPEKRPFEYDSLDSFTINPGSINTVLTINPTSSNYIITGTTFLPNSSSGITISGSYITISNCTFTGPTVFNGDHITITGSLIGGSDVSGI